MSEQEYIPIDPQILDWLAELGEVHETLISDPESLIWKWDALRDDTL